MITCYITKFYFFPDFNPSPPPPPPPPVWHVVLFICLPIVGIVITALALYHLLAASSRKKWLLIVTGALSVVLFIGIIVWFTASRIAGVGIVVGGYAIVIIGFGVYAHFNLSGRKDKSFPL